MKYFLMNVALNLTIEAIKKPLKSTFVNLNGFLEIQFLSAFYHITAFVS